MSCSTKPANINQTFGLGSGRDSFLGLVCVGRENFVLYATQCIHPNQYRKGQPDIHLVEGRAANGVLGMPEGSGAFLKKYRAREKLCRCELAQTVK